jgi:very-short-patch-repair endonuclease
MEELVRVVMRGGGVIRARQFAEAGISRRTIEAALAQGLICRVRSGLYAAPGADPQVLRCAATNSVLTCGSAAEHHGLWVLRRTKLLHLLRPDGKLSLPGTVIHRRSWEPGRGAPRVASALDTVLHALTCLPELEALVVAESAVLRGLVTEDDLRSRLLGAGRRRGRAVLDLVEARGSDSLVETLARTHLRRAGLRVEHQMYVEGVGPMDLLIEGCVDLETDGREHEQPMRRHRDYQRDIAAQVRGYAVARTTYSDVVYSPERMVAQVVGVVGRRLAMGALPTDRPRPVPSILQGRMAGRR